MPRAKGARGRDGRALVCFPPLALNLGADAPHLVLPARSQPRAAFRRGLAVAAEELRVLVNDTLEDAEQGARVKVRVTQEALLALLLACATAAVIEQPQLAGGRMRQRLTPAGALNRVLLAWPLGDSQALHPRGHTLLVVRQLAVLEVAEEVLGCARHGCSSAMSRSSRAPVHQRHCC